MSRAIGAAMLATPFVGLFIACVVIDGWGMAFTVFGIVAAVLVWTYWAVRLWERRP